MHTREQIAAGDFLPDSVDLLVEHRLLLHDRTATHLQHKVALGREMHALGALELKSDLAGVGSWTNHEVVLEGTMVAVKAEIHAGIDSLILHPGIGGNISQPF